MCPDVPPISQPASRRRRAEALADIVGADDAGGIAASKRAVKERRQTVEKAPDVAVKLHGMAVTLDQCEQRCQRRHEQAVVERQIERDGEVPSEARLLDETMPTALERCDGMIICFGCAQEHD